jgi:hypothetical protein
MLAGMAGVPVTDARSPTVCRVGEADLLFAGLGERAFEVARDLAQEDGVRGCRRLEDFSHHTSPGPGLENARAATGRMRSYQAGPLSREAPWYDFTFHTASPSFSTAISRRWGQIRVVVRLHELEDVRHRDCDQSGRQFSRLRDIARPTLHAGASTVRYRVLTSLALAAVVGLNVGCSSDSAGPSDPPGPPVVTDKFTCDSGLNCTLKLASSGGFKIAVTGSDCVANDNKLELSSPVDSVLTRNGCSLKAGDEWTFPGPYDAGTVVALKVTSAKLKYDPQLRVTQLASGAYPSWHVKFEDGGDQDFNDIELDIITTP